MRQKNYPRNASRPFSVAAISVLGLFLSACSSDVSRFDFPSFGLNKSAKPTPPAPMASKAPRRSSDYAFRPNYREDIAPGVALGGNGERGGYDRSRDVASAQLPSVERPRAIAPVSRPAPDYRDSAPAYRPEPKPAPRFASDKRRSGSTVTVRSGDTLYGIARSNGITVAALRNANSLNGATIKPGQTLRLPGSSVAAPSANPESSFANAAPRSSGSYSVQRGDSLYGIARRNNIRVSELLSANNISDPRALKPGQRLTIPGASNVASAPSQKPARTNPTSSDYTRYAEAKPAPQARQPEVGGYQRIQKTRVIRSPGAAAQAVRKPKRVALLPAPDAMSSSKFRWPAQGRLVGKFGKRGNGTHNDGINIAVPKGTPIKAAENGVVAYAGSELKGYGNLILIRHADNWVSAYAHADTINVKRGDQIRRGQVIASAGMTGEVERPQLHFELRRGSKPVDPMRHLASN